MQEFFWIDVNQMCLYKFLICKQVKKVNYYGGNNLYINSTFKNRTWLRAIKKKNHYCLKFVAKIILRKNL